MTGQVTISVWAFVALILFTLWAVLDRILIPSVRWYLRRRINLVLDEISIRLDIEIKPLQITKRQVLIDRLVYDAKVIEAIQAQAQENNIPRQVLQARVLSYAKEIVPSFNAYIYFRSGYWLAKKVARLLYRVRVGFRDKDQLASVDPEATVVFVMNHRSNMDYILVAFLVAERTALSYAVGEWAKIWPLQTLIRAMGAYFVRRKSRNPLYRLVLERYIHMATKEGVCQAAFLEGGLSRDGRLQKPKLGLLDYMLRSFDPNTDRDIVFIPVGINYDRTLEDRSLLRTLDPHAEKRSKWFVARTTLVFLWRNLLLMARNKWHRFGYAGVTFGPPLSAREYCRFRENCFEKMDRNDRFAQVGRLAEQMMAAVETIIPILPMTLLSTVLLEAQDQWLSDFDVKVRVYRLMDDLERKGAPISVRKETREQAIESAFHLLKIRRLVLEADGLFRADPDSLAVLSYYANAMAHWKEHEKTNIE
jgi:glycerol-3-phosphate O-acyltransferase